MRDQATDAPDRFAWLRILLGQRAELLFQAEPSRRFQADPADIEAAEIAIGTKARQGREGPLLWLQHEMFARDKLAEGCQIETYLEQVIGKKLTPRCPARCNGFPPEETSIICQRNAGGLPIARASERNERV